MLFQTKLVVFGKSVSQKVFLSFENGLNVAAGTKRRSQVTGHRSQVTGHRSQVTENLMKKVRHSAKLFKFICLLYFRLSHNQAYVWYGPLFPVLFWEKRTKL